jgi:hypothetical protein
MNNLFLKFAFIIVTLSLLLTGYIKTSLGSNSIPLEQSNNEAVFDTLKLKNQLAYIIENMRDSSAITKLLENSGASYVADFTLPFKNSDKLITANKTALGIGMYIFDYRYACTYQRNDQSTHAAIIIKQLIAQLGLQGELTSAQNYLGRIQNNAENKDSVDYLTNKAFQFVHQQFINGTRPDIYALILIGGNIEALYVLTQLANISSDNQKLLYILNEERERFSSVYSLLELLSDNLKIRRYFQGWQHITKVIQSKENIGEAELQEIIPLIENIRNGMI